MNGELEQAFYGSNILEYRDGNLHCHAAPAHEQGQVLRQAVESALQQYLAIHPLNTATM